MNAAVFIASPLVGAGIGYITNWIAIKMLFRPLYPVRVFGKEIPSLQGVIPKRHKDLAKSIGRTVGEHLLTEDAFASLLKSAETREQVRLLVRGALKALQNEERTLEEVMASAIPDAEQREIVLEQGAAWISAAVLDVIRSEKTLDALQRTVEEFLRTGIHEFVDSDDYARLKFTVREYILVQLRNPAMEVQLAGWVAARVEEWKENERPLREWVPGELVERVKELLLTQGPAVCQQIVGFLDLPETRAQIEAKIEQFFQRGFWMSMLGKLFADKDKITDMVIDQLAGFLQEPANQAVITDKINGVLDQMLATPVAELASRIDGELVRSISGWMYEKVTTPAFVDTLLDNLEELLIRNLPGRRGCEANLPAPLHRGEEEGEVSQEQTSEAGRDLAQTWREAAVSLESSSSQQAVGSLVRQILTDILQSRFVADGAENLIRGQLHSLRQRSVKSFFARLQMTVAERAEEGVLGILDFVHRNYLGKILTVFNFGRLVEEKVLSFDLEEMEAIVLDVMSVELRAVTNFGLYLGFVMGFLTPLFNWLIGA